MIKSSIVENKYFYLFISFILLIPTFSFPFSMDNAIFMLGGKSLINGGILYQDFIDIKPPLIYYIFAFCAYFSSSEISIRIFDVIFQMLVLSWAYNILAKLFTLNSAKIFVIFYSLYYVSINIPGPMQTENFLVPILLGLLQTFQSKYSINTKLILSAGLISIAFMFKFTFLIILIPFYFAFYNEYFFKNFIKSNLVFFISLLTSIILITLLTFTRASYDGYNDVMHYLSNYIPRNTSLISTLEYTIKKIGQYFGDYYSLFNLFFTGFGIKYLIDNYIQNFKKEHLFILLLIPVFIFSIIFEQKFFPYHYSRMMLPLIICLSIGLESIFLNYRKVYRKKLYLVVISFFILFSNFPRWTAVAIHTYNYFVNYDKYLDYHTKTEKNHNIGYHIELANYINENSKSNDFIIFMDNHGPQLLLMIDNPHTFSPNSCFYTHVNSPENWLIKFEAELDIAKYIICGKADQFFDATGHHLSSYQWLMSNPNYRAILNNYKVVIDNDRYIMYEKLLISE